MSPRAPAPAFAFAWASDTGRLRRNNEDALRVDAAAGLAVLADGMGGYNAGEVASQLAVDEIHRQLRPWLIGPGRSARPEAFAIRLRAAVAEAHQAILAAAQRQPAWSGMGTTVVIAALQGGGVHLAHVGDSRAYRWGAGGLQQLSRDHSLLQDQLDAGLIRPEDAREALHRNLVTRALGVEAGVEADLAWHPLAAGDGLMLCSDGLSDMLDDAQLARLLARPGPLDETAAALVAAANAAGGRDNISLVLIRAPAPTVRPRSWWSLGRG